MSSYGGNGNTSFGASHNVLLAFFSNLTEVDQRLSTLETKTTNQTAVAGTTTFTGIISAGTLIKSGGLVSEFLKANGTVDSNTYVTNPTYNLGVSTLNNALTILPMTSNILPSGYIATSDFAGTANFQAFDLNTATSYSSYANYSGLTGTYTGYIQTPLLPFGTLNGDWLQIQFPSLINVMGYTIASSVSLSQVPSTFTLLSSTDGVNWTAQDSEVASQWVLGVSKTFTFPSPITSKYFRLSVYLVGNTGTSSRNNFVINELTLNQNTVNNSVTVPTLISNKTTFTDNNELISKQYVDSNITPLTTKTYNITATPGTTNISGTLIANTLSKVAGLTTQFLKADGTVDANTYLTTGSASSTYVPLSGGTMTGTLNTTSIDTATVVPMNIGTVNAGLITLGRAGQSVYCPSTINGVTIGLSGGNSSQYLRGSGIVYTRNTCISPFGAPLEQIGISNFGGTNYSVQSFYMPESLDITSLIMNRSVLTSTTISVAIYNSSLARIFTSTLTATTSSTLTFSANFGMTGGAYYYFAVYGTGTAFYAGTKAGSTIVNSGLNASLQYASFSVASTTLPATLPTTGILISSVIQPPFTLVGY